MSEASGIRSVGLVVHPKRDIDRALDAVRTWADEHDVRVGQVSISGQERRVADQVEADDCDLLLAIGGDGTALAALHASAEASCAVLGIACGSIGALTSVTNDHTSWALDEVAAGRWSARSLPAIELGGDPPRCALNDISVVRAGGGQVTVAIWVDDDLYGRVAGDGAVVSTPMGSSAYTMAAGGPLLVTECESFVVTPIAPHGGSVPPLVVGSAGRLRFEVDPGHGGMRLEIDGQTAEAPGEVLEIARRDDYATLVGLRGEDTLLAGLRRRGLVLDSPRATLREKRGVRPG